MEPIRIFLSAGTNLGNREENLVFVAQLLPPAVKILRTSPVYQTEPWGEKDQPDFLNLVWEAETTLPPEDLLRYLKSIERRMGRQDSYRYGPRLIDIDILLYGERQIASDALTIPHAQLANRRFVLQPLIDLEPDGRHPVTGVRWTELLTQAPREALDLLPIQPDFDRKVFRWGQKTYLMGILNLTPDSFSADGLIRQGRLDRAATIDQAGQFLAAGADILDLGAESTRPGHTPVTAAAETERLLPAIEALRSAFPAATLSIDTSKAAVAEAAIAAGADWVNDVGGGMADPCMADTCARLNVPLVLMRSQPLNPAMPTFEQVRAELELLVQHAANAGVRAENMLLDPGIGFGTTPGQNLEILRNLDRIKSMGLPLLVGTSRKSFIGHYLQRETGDRLAGTAASVTAAILRGADVVRVHDVPFLADLVRLSDLISR